MTIEMDYALLLENSKIEYANLIKTFLSISKPHIEAGASKVLQDLKNHYSSVIKSARTTDYINTLEDLLRVLEKRDRLSYDNIEPLKYISTNYVRDPSLARSLENYEGRVNARPVVPLFNVYDLPSGKYNCENITRDTSNLLRIVVTLDPPSNIAHCRTNHEQTRNENATTNNDLLQLCRGIQSPAEDTSAFFNDTEIFSINNVTTVGDNGRTYSINSCTICIETMRHIVSKWNTAMTMRFLRVAVPIFLVTTFYMLGSVLWYENQPGISGSSTSNGGLQGHQIRAQMTLYTTTEPAFRLVLPGSVEIGCGEPSSNKGNAEVARMVLLEVCDKLGRHWRDVARFLGVTEYDIDGIDHQSQLPLKEKAFKALLKIQSNSDPSQWEIKLKRALEKARRRDLMEMVDELSLPKYQPE